MDSFVQLVRHVSMACGIVAAGLITAAVAIVCQMVFVRFVLGHATIWQTDFTTYALVAATFVGSPYVLMTRGHVNVDIVPLHVSGGLRFGLAVVTSVLAFAFCLVMTWISWRFWYEAWASNWVSDTVWRVRLWIPYASMPVGFALLTLQYVADLICLLSGREPPFGIRDEAKGTAT